MLRPSTFWTAALVAAVVCGTGMARAQAPDPHAAVVTDASGLAHEVWTIRDGLPLSHLNGVIQPRDRYLWLASFDGLIRFDGARFTVFNTATNPELPTNRFVSIIEGPDGDVWAAAEFDYVVRWLDGAFEVHGLADERMGTAIRAIQFDSAGTLWVSTNRGVYMKRGQRMEPLGDESLRRPVLGTFLDSSGAVWIGSDGAGAFRWQDGQVRQVRAGAPPRSSLVTSFAEAADGTVYIGTGVAVLAWRDGKVTTLLPAGLDEIWVRSLHRLGPESVLAVTDSGLFTPHGGHYADHRPAISAAGSGPIPFLIDSRGDHWLAIRERLYRNEELVFEGRFPIASIAVDHEGSLWIAADGLHRLKPALFHVYGPKEGALSNIYPILEDSRGRIWLGSLNGGIALYSNGSFGILEKSTGRDGCGSEASAMGAASSTACDASDAFRFSAVIQSRRSTRIELGLCGSERTAGCTGTRPVSFSTSLPGTGFHTTSSA
jgi:ligand-binding sensor domain-containing protein